MNRYLTSLCLLWFVLTSRTTVAQSPALVELVEGEKAYRGKVVARNQDYVWLVEQSGALHTLGLTSITKFRKVDDKFRPLGAADLRDRLRRELGNSFEIVGTGHYLVAGPPQLVRNYADIFEEQYRAVYTYFSVRGLDIRHPEFPLVAVVFPDPGSFREYAQSDNVLAGGGLKGYYMQSTNRIALFHELPRKSAWRETDSVGELLFGNAERGLSTLHQGLADRLSWANIEGDLQDTMLHEATHQVAFNVGIHSRIGQNNPRWLVEGLATAFEAPGMRSSSLANTPSAKWNLSRLAAFREFVKQRRVAKSLSEFIQSDLKFGENVLDGYAQAWALTFFLMETRPREFGRYVKAISARPPLEPYEDAARLQDFQAAFSSDLTLLEAKFLRFMSELK